MPASEPTFAYLPDGIFTATEGREAGRARSVWLNEIELIDSESEEEAAK
jgi:hypothetical protein